MWTLSRPRLHFAPRDWDTKLSSVLYCTLPVHLLYSAGKLDDLDKFAAAGVKFAAAMINFSAAKGSIFAAKG